MIVDVRFDDDGSVIRSLHHDVYVDGQWIIRQECWSRELVQLTNELATRIDGGILRQGGE